jgi:putative DNA methylase
MTSAPKKLIEVALPLDDINREAAREKSIRHGHPSTLHLWWARRPLAACRAVLFAQLVDDPSAHPERFPTPEAQAAERERLFAILRELVKWENSNNEQVLEAARAEIRRCYPDGPPPIVDPFCGGGSIPLEAQRLGLEVHASDLNPVAVLITKALVELPAKFAGRPPVHPGDGERLSGTQVWTGAKALAEDVRWYGQWMRDEAERRIGHLYPKATLPDGSQATVIAWLWARTVTCPNPACGSTMPLVRSFWLGKKKGKEAWVNPIPDPVNRRVWFEIGHGRQGPPIEGTVGRTGATCLVCDTPVPLQYVREEGRSGRMGAQLMAIVAEGNRQRTYLPPTPEHERAADVPRPEDTPDTELPAQALGFRVQAYGMTRHADLFTPRQLTALCTFSDLVTEAHTKILADSGGDTAYADAVATYLGFVVSRQSDYSNALTGWVNAPNMEIVRNLFARQAIPMVWDYGEANVFGPSSGSFTIMLGAVTNALERVPASGAGAVAQEDATDSDLRGLLLATDPPYYDNIGYADLSDFFYVWLRRSLRGLYPALLATMLTPKAEELIASPYRFDGDKKKAEIHFESGIQRTFSHAATQCRNDGPLTIFYAFKQSEGEADDVASTGWEKMLSGLIESGLAVTGTWPMRTEKSGRMLAMGTNALASSIVLVCRPRPTDAGVTDRRGFLNELKAVLRGALHDLRSGGVAPVDLAQAAIGPGMAVFSSYAKVVEPDGSPMRVRTALALINQVLDELEAEHEGEFDEETRWATAWYAEFGFDEGPFGRADDLARAKNVAVDGLVRAGIATSRAGKVRLLERSELPADWDPTTDTKLTVWEVTQHLIRILLGDGGEQEAAALVAKVGGFAEPARDLAYRLFELSERRGWAKEAGPYNALAAAWPELTRLAASSPTAAQLF